MLMGVDVARSSSSLSAGGPGRCRLADGWPTTTLDPAETSHGWASTNTSQSCCAIWPVWPTTFRRAGAMSLCGRRSEHHHVARRLPAPDRHFFGRQGAQERASADGWNVPNRPGHLTVDREALS